MKFGNTTATSFTVTSPTSITAISPAQTSGLVDIRVVTGLGTSAAVTGAQFTYTTPIVTPSVTSLGSSSGSTAGGNTLTIQGSDFNAVSEVSFGGVAASSYTVVSATTIQATVPAKSAGTVDVTVTNSAGTSAVSALSKYTYVSPVPTVSSLGTNTGPTTGGTSVSITGTNFSGTRNVWFGDIAASSYSVLGSSSIVAIAPAQAVGIVDIIVENADGRSVAVNPGRYTYTLPLPTISSLGTTSGSTAGGMVVTITGTNLADATDVSFGGVAAQSFTILSATSIQTIAPAHSAGVVDVRVTSPAGLSPTGASSQFNYQSSSGNSNNSSPTAGEQIVSTWRDASVVFSLAGRSSTTEAILYTLSTLPEHGTVTINDGKATFTPAAGFIGTDSFSYVAHDSQGASEPTPVTLTVGELATTLGPNSVVGATGTGLSRSMTATAWSATMPPPEPNVHVGSSEVSSSGIAASGNFGDQPGASGLFNMAGLTHVLNNPQFSYGSSGMTMTDGGTVTTSIRSTQDVAGGTMMIDIFEQVTTSITAHFGYSPPGASFDQTVQSFYRRKISFAGTDGDGYSTDEWGSYDLVFHYETQQSVSTFTKTEIGSSGFENRREGPEFMAVPDVATVSISGRYDDLDSGSSHFTRRQQGGVDADGIQTIHFQNTESGGTSWEHTRTQSRQEVPQPGIPNGDGVHTLGSIQSTVTGLDSRSHSDSGTYIIAVDGTKTSSRVWRNVASGEDQYLDEYHFISSSQTTTDTSLTTRRDTRHILDTGSNRYFIDDSGVELVDSQGEQSIDTIYDNFVDGDNDQAVIGDGEIHSYETKPDGVTIERHESYTLDNGNVGDYRDSKKNGDPTAAATSFGTTTQSTVFSGSHADNLKVSDNDTLTFNLTREKQTIIRWDDDFGATTTVTITEESRDNGQEKLGDWVNDAQTPGSASADQTNNYTYNFSDVGNNDYHGTTTIEVRTVGYVGEEDYLDATQLITLTHQGLYTESDGDGGWLTVQGATPSDADATTPMPMYDDVNGNNTDKDIDTNKGTIELEATLNSRRLTRQDDGGLLETIVHQERQSDITQAQASKVVEEQVSQGALNSPGERDESEEEYKVGGHWTDIGTGSWTTTTILTTTVPYGTLVSRTVTNTIFSGTETNKGVAVGDNEWVSIGPDANNSALNLTGDLDGTDVSTLTESAQTTTTITSHSVLTIDDPETGLETVFEVNEQITSNGESALRFHNIDRSQVTGNLLPTGGGGSSEDDLGFTIRVGDADVIDSTLRITVTINGMLDAETQLDFVETLTKTANNHVNESIHTKGEAETTDDTFDGYSKLGFVESNTGTAKIVHTISQVYTITNAETGLVTTWNYSEEGEYDSTESDRESTASRQGHGDATELANATEAAIPEDDSVPETWEVELTDEELEDPEVVVEYGGFSSRGVSQFNTGLNPAILLSMADPAGAYTPVSTSQNVTESKTRRTLMGEVTQRLVIRSVGEASPGMTINSTETTVDTSTIDITFDESAKSKTGSITPDDESKSKYSEDASSNNKKVESRPTLNRNATLDSTVNYVDPETGARSTIVMDRTQVGDGSRHRADESDDQESTIDDLVSEGVKSNKQVGVSVHDVLRIVMTGAEGDLVNPSLTWRQEISVDSVSTQNETDGVEGTDTWTSALAPRTSAGRASKSRDNSTRTLIQTSLSQTSTRFSPETGMTITTVLSDTSSVDQLETERGSEVRDQRFGFTDQPLDSHVKQNARRNVVTINDHYHIRTRATGTDTAGNLIDFAEEHDLATTGTLIESQDDLPANGGSEIAVRSHSQKLTGTTLVSTTADRKITHTDPVTGRRTIIHQVATFGARTETSDDSSDVRDQETFEPITERTKQNSRDSAEMHSTVRVTRTDANGNPIEPVQEIHEDFDTESETVAEAWKGEAGEGSSSTTTTKTTARTAEEKTAERKAKLEKIFSTLGMGAYHRLTNYQYDSADSKLKFLKGFADGFIKDGLLGNVEMLKSAITFAIKYSPFTRDFVMMYSDFVYGDPYAEYRLDYEAVENAALAAEAGFEWIVDFGRELINGQTELLTAIFLGDEKRLERNGIKLILISEFLADPLLDAMLDLSEEITDPELHGRICGNIYYEILEELATVGTAAAVKGVKVCAALKKFENLLEVKSIAGKAKWLKSLEKLSEAVGKIRQFLKMCFAAGTLVHTVDGLRAIEEIRPGDLVLSRPETADPTTTPARPRRVLNVFETHPNELYHLQLKSSDGHIETISTTGNHPFYSVESREFVHASELVVGTRLVGIDGRIVIVSSVNRQLAPAGETFSTYNLEVEDDHTYHVGTAGVWVHNTSTDDCLKLAKKFADGAPDALENLRDALKKNPKLRDSIAKDLLKQVDELPPSLFITADDFKLLPKSGRIDPKKIRFSQDDIAADFKNGVGSVEDLAAKLKVGEVDPSTIPPIQIVVKDGDVYSLDNRRLKAFQDAGVDIPFEKLDSLTGKQLRKFSTKNDGVRIRPRGRRK